MGNLAYTVTDLILGLAVVTCAVRLLTVPAVHRYWHMTFWFAGAGAFAGAAHHGLFNTGASWIAVGVLVVIAISYYLIASAREVLSRRWTRIVAVIRGVGVAAYGAAVAVGESGLLPLLLCESLTMASILGLWLYAGHVGHPMAVPMAVAISVNALAGVVFALPASLTTPIGLDSTALSHLAQIPGMLLLYRAVVRGTRSRQLR
ncbi:MAG: hypothetical protein GEV03_27275 [Streptosporangiales bacterium]|nr:hypothetical protein [Streptosporangiales bacterium]